MSVLPEKIALRRMLQEFVHRLDETIVESMSFPQEEFTACQFFEDGIIVWQDRRHVFTPSTYTLLKQFFEAPNKMLSKEDVRQDVLYDDDASEGSIRQCILEARKELRRSQFPCRIETIVRKGYRLVTDNP